jgi:hypothetical protein
VGGVGNQPTGHRIHIYLTSQLDRHQLKQHTIQLDFVEWKKW